MQDIIREFEEEILSFPMESNAEEEGSSIEDQSFTGGIVGHAAFVRLTDSAVGEVTQTYLVQVSRDPRG
jgi:hypothetical protein